KWAHFAIFSVFWLARTRSGKTKKGPHAAVVAASLTKSRRRSFFPLLFAIFGRYGMLDAVADGLPWHTPFTGNCPVDCRQAKLAANRESSFLPPGGTRTTSRNASEAIAPFRGSRMVGQISQTAPPSAPPTSRLPSFPQGDVGG